MTDQDEIKKENGEEKTITCPLCGNTFTEGMKTGCFSCPMEYKKCYFEKCPHCGYDIPMDSRVWNFVKKIKAKIQGEKEDGGQRDVK